MFNNYKVNSSYDFYKEEKKGWKYHSFEGKITKISTKELLKNKLNDACLLVYKRKSEKEELEKRSYISYYLFLIQNKKLKCLY